MVTLRPARSADAAWLLALRNEPAVRQASTTIRRVGRAAHARWMARCMVPDSPRRCWLAVIEQGQRIGYARWDRAGCQGGAVVSIAVAPGFRGCGAGRRMLGMLWRQARRRGLCRLEANIRTGNIASLICFLKIGYRITGATGEWVRLVREVGK